MTPKNLRDRDNGFTLIELLIAIVVVGILAGVVILGIGALTDRGEASACTASRDAASAASTVFFANTGRYPDSLDDMTNASPAILQLPTTTPLAAGALTYTTNGWTLTMAVPSGGAPTFACS